MFEIEYTHENNSNWYKDIQDVNDEILLFNFTEPYSLYPLIGEQPSPSSLFYHLIKNNKKVKVVDCGINLRRNFDLIKKKLNSDLDLDLNVYPWYFMNFYFRRDRYKNHKEYDLKYNSIFLLGGHKMCRIFILLELSKNKNLLYSNFGWTQDLKYFANVVEYYCENDKFILKTDQGNFKVNGDDSVDTFIFENEYFRTDEYKYFTINENAYEKVSKDEPIFLYELAPDQFMESGFSFFCETQTEYSSSLTEKTIKNLFYKKPFLGFACDGFYKFLKDNGFELYDEVFDYSFDDFSYGKRLNSYLIECKKVLDLKLNDIKDLVEKLKPKIEHNYENCKTILKNSSMKMSLKFILNNLSVKV